jgi:hypothetical protein
VIAGLTFESASIPDPRKWIAGGLALLSVSVFAGWQAQIHPQLVPLLFDEGGWQENMQLVALAAAFLAYCLRAARSEGAVAVICIGMALLLVLAISREVPNCSSDLYAGGLCFPKSVKNAIAITALLAGAIMLYRRRKDIRAALTLRVNGVFWPLWISLALLAGAEIAERRGVVGLEETLELSAYCYTLALGIWLLRET